MKIKNEFVKIKTNKNEITLKNLILDKYLSIFSKCEYDEETAKQYGVGNKHLARCYVKLDVPLNKEIKHDMELVKSDFDIYLEEPVITQIGNENIVSILYGYTNEYGYYDIKEDIYVFNFQQLGEHKITAIAFGNANDDMLAILDTSTYDLSIPAESIINISRKDNFSTDAILSGADFPLHLAPIGIKETKLFGDQAMFAYEYGLLYSVGLSGTPGVMQEEYVVGEDIEVVPIDDYSFKFALIKSTENTKYPQLTTQPSLSKFPVRFNTIAEKQPLATFFPNSTKYPMQPDYKYIIMKFKTYYIHRTLDSIVWTGEEYTLSIYTETKGLFEVVTKIERGDE